MGFKAFALLAAAVVRGSRAKWSASAVLSAMLIAPSRWCFGRSLSVELCTAGF